MPCYATEVAGLELDDGSGEWLPIERLASADDIVVFAADQLHAAAIGGGSRVRAVSHRVAIAPETERMSLLFELRAPVSFASCSACRHGRRLDSCPVCQYYPVS